MRSTSVTSSSVLAALVLVGGLFTTSAAASSEPSATDDSAPAVTTADDVDTTTETIDITGQDITAAGGCSGSVWAPPGFQGETAATIGCSIAGSPGHRVGYSWSTPADVSVCVWGRGFNEAGAEEFHSLGCGQSGGGVVPWGNTLAEPAVRAQSMGIPLGAVVHFSSP